MSAKRLRAWLYLLTRYEVRLRGPIARARNTYIRTAQKQYTLNEDQPAWMLSDHRDVLEEILKDHYTATIAVFGKLALSDSKSYNLRQRKKKTPFTALMQEWITTEALRKATSIAHTDEGDVRDAISLGIEEGLGTEAIARAIRDVTGLTPFRASTVARTETHNAATFGSIESTRQAAQETGARVLKVWLPTLDDRTRPEHLAMKDSDPIPLDQKFVVGGEALDRPGDPIGKPENIINCRCAIAFEEQT